jgi:hypothetical protein
MNATSQSYLTTDGKPVSLSWCQGTIWDPRTIFLSGKWKLSSDTCDFVKWGALYDKSVDLQFRV